MIKNFSNSRCEGGKSGADPAIESFNDPVFGFPFLADLKDAARDSDWYLPFLRDDSAALYRFLIALKQPRRIFEAGTLFGYSALLAAFALKSVGVGDFKIVTCEISEDNAAVATDNISKAGFSGNIDVLNGDAAEILRCLSGKFDLIFLDSAKGQYVNMLPDIKSHIAEGGLLVCDDVLYHELSGIPAAEAPHKHRTIVASLARFIDAVKNDGDFTSFIDFMDDGLLAAVYRSNGK